MREKNEFGCNRSLKRAARRAAKNYCEENFIAVLCELLDRINSDVEVPAPIENVTFFTFNFDPDVELEDVVPAQLKLEYNLALLEDVDGYIWLPLFTSREEIDQLGGNREVRRVTVRELFEQCVADDRLYGIVIDPFSTFFPLLREQVEWILDKADEELEDAV